MTSPACICIAEACQQGQRAYLRRRGLMGSWRTPGSLSWTLPRQPSSQGTWSFGCLARRSRATSMWAPL